MSTKRVLQLSAVILFLSAAADLLSVALNLREILSTPALARVFFNPSHPMHNPEGLRVYGITVFSAAVKLVTGILALRQSVVSGKATVCKISAIATVLLSVYTLRCTFLSQAFSPIPCFIGVLAVVLILSALAYSGAGKTKALRITVGIAVLCWALLNLMYPYFLILNLRANYGFLSANISVLTGSLDPRLQMYAEQFRSSVGKILSVGIPNFLLLLLTGITALISFAKPKMARVSIMAAVLAAVSCCALVLLPHPDYLQQHALAFPAMGTAVCAVCIVSMLLREKPVVQAEENISAG